MKDKGLANIDFDPKCLLDGIFVFKPNKPIVDSLGNGFSIEESHSVVHRVEKLKNGKTTIHFTSGFGMFSFDIMRLNRQIVKSKCNAKHKKWSGEPTTLPETVRILDPETREDLFPFLHENFSWHWW